MKVYTLTMGCKVNQYETEKILDELIKLGLSQSNDIETSDIIIFNTCTVTGESDRKVLSNINKIRRLNSKGILAVIGCFSEMHSEKLKNSNKVDIILGNTNKYDIIKIVSNIKNSNSQNCSEIWTNTNLQKRTRAFLKIQDGCNNFCSYCIIPYARGRTKSKSLKDIINESKKLADNGYKEIVLTGINLACYGNDIDKNLYNVVEEISKISSIKRIRFSSLEPDFFSEDNITQLSKIKQLCPHFHLSVQSGSDKILKKMRRKYTVKEYINICDLIYKYFENPMITTDLMVGFPGETEVDFQNSLNLIYKIKFLKVHVFPYSPRPGTLAATFDNQIDKNIKSLRVNKVINISKNITKDIFKNQIGKTLNVLYESADKNNYYEGYTNNYIRVKTKSSTNITGKIIPTKITGIDLENLNNMCIGTI